MTPKFSANAQTEFGFNLSDTAEGFVQGRYSFYGETVPSQSNLLDDVGAYGLLGGWELTVFGKNILRERETLTLAGSPSSTNYQIGATASTFVSEYRAPTVTAPREFGVSFRIAFGSH